MSQGHTGALHLDARQEEELFLTAAQSLLAVVLILRLNLTWWGAVILAVLFTVQFALPTVTARLVIAWIYVGLAVVVLMVRRTSLRDLHRTVRENRRHVPAPASRGVILLHWRVAMMLEWEVYQKELLARIAELGVQSPGTVRGYRELTDAGSKKDTLGAKTRELIALAVAVTRQCDGCITIHTSAALRHGATRDEIAEALGVAIAVNAGAALVFSGRVMDAFAAKSAAGPAPV